MKKSYFLIAACILINLISLTGNAQKPAKRLHFNNGSIEGIENVLNSGTLKTTLRPAAFNKKFYVLAQFRQLPDSAQRGNLAGAGITISNYLYGNTYYAEMPDSMEAADLLKFDISGVYNLSADIKFSEKLQKRISEKKFKTTPDQPVAISFYGTISAEDVKKSLIQAGARILDIKFSLPHLVFIDADATTLKTIANLPFIEYISQQVLKDIPVNYNNRSRHALDALSAGSGRNLQGKGVTIGIGDDANQSTHIDFNNRLIIRTPNGFNNHGTHTAGTAAGGGILNPLYRGMAPLATLISKSFSDVLVDAPVYIADNNMVLTSNSYYSGEADCTGNGEYNFLSYYADYEQNAYPALLHVFASGNDGKFTCTPFIAPYSTVKSGFQCAKNVLTVGNFNAYNDSMSLGSSAGPVDDGRIKPEIVAAGTNITSTYPNNTYSSLSGTSMATPTASGTLALLYERFRQLYSGNPPGALIKAIACNSADDAGNPGPDFMFGFGVLNARKAVETVEKGTFLSDIISNGATKSYILPVPSNVRQVKIMLYWSDPAFSGGGPVSLINNLDLKVTTPASVVHLPLVLNPAAGSASNNAAEMADNLNNIEQVVLNAPASGNYTIGIKGTSIPAGPQRFYIVYEISTPAVTVEYPFGNETWVPGEVETIRWSANDGDITNFTIEYSTDNGSTWTVIDNNIPADKRSLAWTVPAVPGSGYLIRVSRNSTAYSDTSDYPFTIVGQPSLTVTNPCQGYAALAWSTVSGAASYQIMMLNGDTMKTITSTATTSYLVPGLDKNKTYWFAVRALIGSTPGRRSVAVGIQPSAGACTLTGFDNDLSIDSIPAPVTGRMLTSSQLKSNESIMIRIRNLGNIPSSGAFNVSYSINGGTPVTESVSTVLADHSFLPYTFTNTADLSAAGTYTVKVWVDYPADITHTNDTLTTVIKQLQNTALTLAPSFSEGFETAAASSYTARTMGLDGLDRCDFNTDNFNGRARTFVNSGFSRTGTRCITLDQVYNYGIAVADSLITTFNLSAYTTSDNILLNFFYKNHGNNTSMPGNAVWVRGSETSDWIRVFVLPVSTSDIGGYRSSPYINLTESLKNAVPAQNFTSSFQVKFGQNGYKPANSPDAPGIDIDNGFSFDDITLILTQNDVSVTAITQPIISGVCALSGSEPVSVQVKNTGSVKLFNVPVKYKVNGITVTGNIDSIDANSSLIYDFAAPADLSAYKAYTMQVWADYGADTYHFNDTISISFRTSPLISSFPYMEGFESSDGYWFTGGINSSWIWGTPSKPVITGAASGTKVWVTGLTGDYNNSEYSFLYSPCFNVSGLANPALGFSHIFRTEDNCECDRHWAEYSTDDVNWIRLGASGSGKNWYDNAALQVWKASRTTWHESIINIPVSASKIRFRIVMNSDAALDYDGVAIDNVRIFDSSFTTLPLTLLSFKAERKKANGILTWTTAREINTEAFVIQKSNDNLQYLDAGTVKAAGTASGSYSFTDYDLQNGITFYRLKMTDKDGRSALSPVRTIDYEADGLTISIHPNPVVKGLLYIASTSNCNKIELNDVSGRVIKSFNVHGLNHSLDVNDIAAGTYFITVYTAKGKVTKKAVIE